MGMYTRLVLNVPLKASAEATVATVRRMVAGEAKELPNRMPWMLKSSSYYHDNIQHAELTYDELSKAYKLSVVCDLKDYHGEIAEFLTMLAPAADGNCFAGYVLYEEDTVPDLVWYVNGRLVRETAKVSRETQQVVKS